MDLSQTQLLQNMLRSCKVMVDNKDLNLIIRLYELVKANEDPTFSDVAKVQSEVNELK